MSQPVNLSLPTYQKLKYFRNKHQHKSFSAAIEELIRSYWSPFTAEIQIREEFDKIVTYLKSRELLDERTEEALQIAQARAFQYNSEKKRATK